MTHPLASENFSLRQQLETLLHEARRNEDKMRRFDQLERQLIGAGSLLELVSLLLSEYKQAFGVEHVTLALVDREMEATRILEGELDSDAACGGLTLLPSADALEALYGKMRRPSLGFYVSRHQALFNALPGEIASVALLPLIRKGELIGSLHFGSANPERYVADCGTDFLERLAEVVAICLESALTQERLKRVGLTDGLTGVQNRRYFEHRFQGEISQARRHKHPLACMFIDVDKFKRINDTYGHQAGDEVLRSVANVIQSQLRVGDTIARYGGEEFVVLLPQTAGHHAREIAERIRATIAGIPLHVQSGHEINVTISIGLSMLKTDESSGDNKQVAERLLAAADSSLYQAKNTGRNRVVCDDSQPLNSTQGPGWAQALQQLRVRAGSLLRVAHGTVVGLLKNLMQA
jgi:diguanylate cyclase (GGDEF)-like protein